MLTVTHYNADGTAVTSFGSGGKVTTHFGVGSDVAYAVVVGEDGKIVAGGKATNGSREDYALARYNHNGTPDDGFDFDGKVVTDFGGAGGWLWDLAMQDDGRVVAAGITSGSGTGMNFATARYFGGSDATPPKVGAPKHGLAPGAALGAADVPVRLSWSANDVDGEVTSH